MTREDDLSVVSVSPDAGTSEKPMKSAEAPAEAGKTPGQDGILKKLEEISAELAQLNRMLRNQEKKMDSFRDLLEKKEAADRKEAPEKKEAPETKEAPEKKRAFGLSWK